VSSQRIRERRIVERFHAGALALASPSDTVQSTPRGGAPCYGCLEPDADVHVGNRSWHALCVLVWQGRSETLRGHRIPHSQPGPGITPVRSRWVIVVPVGRPDTYAALRRKFARSPWVDVVMDRRRGERQPDGGVVPAGERRTAGRRKTAAPDPASEPAFRLAHRDDGREVYESTAPESGRCPECGALVSVELPRFVEPPVRLELLVRHEATRAAARHVVELQSLSPTGRVLVATRIAGQTRTESGSVGSGGPPRSGSFRGLPLQLRDDGRAR
jgi:hypothetical protein